MSESYGVHWFRRDLRIAGNPALEWNRSEHRGRVLGLFAFDRAFLSRPDFSHHRFAFFLETLRALRKDLRAAGGDLLVLDASPRAAFDQVFAALRERGRELPDVISFNRDYEPFARQRDAEMTRWFERDCGVSVRTERDHLLIEPDELAKPQGGFYQVFTPFAKRWLKLLQTTEMQQRVQEQKAGLKLLAQQARGDVDPHHFALRWSSLLGRQHALQDQLDAYAADNARHVTIELPDAGAQAVFRRLQHFENHSLMRYPDGRDLPALDGTSRMSYYLKNGSITTAMIVGHAGLGGIAAPGGDGPAKFLTELIWREFYYHILYHRPEVEHTAFLEQYRDLKWENREDWFEAWKAGQTGYPIVDAGMRQLATTGWMHNRVRMIVASFLTKDLLIDWRWGERWFMEQLLDGDLAPNNGGWQWAASTGCDAQPYFRIFNPTTQSAKFDPHGDYIHTYVPELRSLKGKPLHQPQLSPNAANYPDPIVDHATQRDRALRLYKAS